MTKRRNPHLGVAGRADDVGSAHQQERDGAHGYEPPCVGPLLDPENPSVTLLTLDGAAAVLGKRLTVSYADRTA